MLNRPISVAVSKRGRTTGRRILCQLLFTTRNKGRNNLPMTPPACISPALSSSATPLRALRNDRIRAQDEQVEHRDQQQEDRGNRDADDAAVTPEAGEIVLQRGSGRGEKRDGDEHHGRVAERKNSPVVTGRSPCCISLRTCCRSPRCGRRQPRDAARKPRPAAPSQQCRSPLTHHEGPGQAAIFSAISTRTGRKRSQTHCRRHRLRWRKRMSARRMRRRLSSALSPSRISSGRKGWIMTIGRGHAAGQSAVGGGAHTFAGHASSRWSAGGRQRPYKLQFYQRYKIICGVDQVGTTKVPQMALTAASRLSNLRLRGRRV